MLVSVAERTWTYNRKTIATESLTNILGSWAKLYSVSPKRIHLHIKRILPQRQQAQSHLFHLLFSSRTAQCYTLDHLICSVFFFHIQPSHPSLTLIYSYSRPNTTQRLFLDQWWFISSLVFLTFSHFLKLSLNLCVLYESHTWTINLIVI